MTGRLEYLLSHGKPPPLENVQIARRGGACVDLLAMIDADSTVRSRILAAMQAQGMTKAELSRRSGVPYHTIDKFLKGVALKTSAENALAMANALGVKLDGEGAYEEMRALFLALPEDKQRFVLETLRGLLPQKQ